MKAIVEWPRRFSIRWCLKLILEDLFYHSITDMNQIKRLDGGCLRGSFIVFDQDFDEQEYVYEVEMINKKRYISVYQDE